MFIDASAIVAMTTREVDDEDLVRELATSDERLYSPIVMWESVTAIARKRKISIGEAESAFQRFVAEFDFRMISIDAAIATVALAAWSRHGKASRDPAQLNMGDCFTYACAKTTGARLLYKGDDFARTDLA